MNQNLFDTLLEPVFVIDKTKKVIYCNEPAALMADLSVRKILRGMKFDEIFTFEQEITPLHSIESITDPTPYVETAFTSIAGKTGKVQITFQALDQSNNESWLIFFRDVTLEETLQKKYRKELEQKEGVIEDLKIAQAELQHYSKNLEKMVEDRTAELSHLNRMLKALLDSLGQGFFIFDQEGNCLEVASKACTTMLGTHPFGKKVWDVLKTPPNKIDSFQKWNLTLFSEMLPFEDLAPLGPSTFPHPEGRHISLEYYPLRSNEEKINGVVVVASDITDLVSANQKAADEHAHAKMITTLVKSKKEVSNLIKEARLLISSLKSDIQKNQVPKDEAFRTLHTLKGGAASFSINSLVKECHIAEGFLTRCDSNLTHSEIQNFTSYVTKIDNEFQNFLHDNRDILGQNTITGKRTIETPVETIVSIYQAINSIPAARPIAYNLLKEVIMEPVAPYFVHYDDVMQMLSISENKKIKPLKIVGGHIPVIPEKYSHLFSSFVHAFRNAVDHGIEAPEVRIENGKDEYGEITLTFEIKTTTLGQRLFIQIQDDGNGINPDLIRNKLEKRNQLNPNENDEEVIQHVFDSELSTKDSVTEISGRGIGMDAILNCAKELGGKAFVKSELKKGTTLIVEVPYFQNLTTDSENKAA